MPCSCTLPELPSSLSDLSQRIYNAVADLFIQMRTLVGRGIEYLCSLCVDTNEVPPNLKPSHLFASNSSDRSTPTIYQQQAPHTNPTLIKVPSDDDTNNSHNSTGLFTPNRLQVHSLDPQEEVIVTNYITAKTSPSLMIFFSSVKKEFKKLDATKVLLFLLTQNTPTSSQDKTLLQRMKESKHNWQTFKDALTTDLNAADANITTLIQKELGRLYADRKSVISGYIANSQGDAIVDLILNKG